ncbi:hypothetical protein QAD02_021106 [Eretmocerus hayati]|uniref:Uncharacterized protein n=1 Tax=Eretmocerus hayati TaxID=131215 RepID=A0ACC2PPC6_9HYME|nr:hypothetical protein QAD02_021106 [Eretmocerus hayati]
MVNKPDAVAASSKAEKYRVVMLDSMSSRATGRCCMWLIAAAGPGSKTHTVSITARIDDDRCLVEAMIHDDPRLCTVGAGERLAHVDIPADPGSVLTSTHFGQNMAAIRLLLLLTDAHRGKSRGMR